MMNKLVIAALAVALTASLGFSGVLWFKSKEVDRLRSDNDTLRLSLAGCNARATNQSEDKKSDAQIDDMPDLTDVPHGWLMPPPIGSGSLY